MSFQADLDNAEKQTGVTPRGFLDPATAVARLVTIHEAGFPSYPGFLKVRW